VLEELGCGPGRRATADGHIYINSNKSLGAMGLLQFMVVFILFGDDEMHLGWWFEKVSRVSL
jgi:hypothetical protein